MRIHPTSIVDPSAYLSEEVEVGAYAYIGPKVEIGPGCRIDHHANIESCTRLGEKTRIWPFTSIGGDAQDLKYAGEETWLEIGAKTQIREFVTINRGTSHGGGVTKVGNNCLLMAYSHVAHDCQLGDHVIMANNATLAGHVVLEDHVSLGGLVAVHQFTRIGRYCFVGGLSGVAQDLPPFCLCEGNRAKAYGLNIVGLKRARFSPETIEALKQTYRIIFRNHIPILQALGKVRALVPDLPEVRHMLNFIISSERGVSR